MANLSVNNQTIDKIEITPSAIELIIGIAVSKMKDVEVVQNKLTTSVKNFLSISLTGKSVSLYELESGELAADIYVAVPYGVSIPKISQAIQKRVKEQVMFMCDIVIAQVNVYVDHLLTGDSID